MKQSNCNSINQTCKKSLACWMDILSLIAVMQYVVYRFLQSTMFNFVYPSKYKYFTMLLLLIMGGIRFFIILFMELKKREETKKRIVYLIKISVVCILAFPFFYVGWKHDYKFLIFMPIVALCLYKMDARRVFRWFVWIVGIMLISTILCCLSGAVKNITRIESGHIISSFGIINTTDFSSYFTFIILFVWCSQKTKGILYELLFSVICILFALVLFWYTDSKTGLICGILTTIVIMVDSFYNIFRKKNKHLFVSRIGNTLLAYSFPLMCISLILLVFLYSKQIPFAVKIDEILAERLRNSLHYFEQYGIHPFGSEVGMMRGYGGNMIRAWSVNGYGYIDCGYAMLAIRYGWVLFLLISFFTVQTVRHASKQGNKRIAFAMAIIAFHAFSEARFLDVNYNILLFMPFCSFGEKNGKELREVEWYSKHRLKLNEIKSPVFGLILFVTVCLLFSRIVSWLRSIFYLERWTLGIHAWNAFLVCVSLILLIFGIWQTVSIYWKKKSVTALIFFFLMAFALAGVSFAGNDVINQGISTQKNHLESEQIVIQLVQKEAKNPVYVAEASELYQRQFGGFTDHVFSTDELYNTQGTIFTDIMTDSMGIFSSGGTFVQISEWSGLYTFDQAVIEALSKQGYTIPTYYTPERRCDLVDLSVRNNLILDEMGRLELKGPMHSLMNNLEWDQYRGTYEVRYQLEINKSDCYLSDTVCTLYAMGEAGDRTILERKVSRNDFDDEGKCEIALSYFIERTPKVSYLIEAAEDMTLYVDEISWKRIS